MAKPKGHSVTMPVSEAYDYAKSEAESLQEEISNWAENLESNNMEHLPKYEEVSECRDAFDDLEWPDFPDVPEGNVTFHEYKPQGRRGLSRSARASNAASALDAVHSHVTEYLDSIEESDDEDTKSEIETFAAEVDSTKDALEGISFPGMF